MACVCVCVCDTRSQLIRSNGQYNLSDVWDKWGVESLTDGFYWQSKPKLGFYCIYRARPVRPPSHPPLQPPLQPPQLPRVSLELAVAQGEKPLVPNCANITGTLTAHANMLVAAGVDYVVTDSTNLGTPSAQADVIQVPCASPRHARVHRPAVVPSVSVTGHGCGGA